MNLPVQPWLTAVDGPPIGEALAWIAGRVFPADKPLIDLCQAVPGYPPPRVLIEHIASALTDPQTHRYTDIAGLPTLRSALAADIARVYGADSVAAANVLITAGCNQAYCLTTLALAKAGDEIVLPLPCYFNHRQWLEMNGVTPRFVPFNPESDGVPGLRAIEAAIGSKTRALVLISPNNPTGAIYPPAFLEAAFDLCRAANIALVLDETYRDFLPADGAPHDLFRGRDWASTLVHLYSFSKVFCLTGHRTGAVVGSPDLLQQIAKAMDCVAICAPRIGQIAAQWGLEHLQDWRADNRRLMRDRLAAFKEALADKPGGYEIVSAGAYFAYLRHPHPNQDSTTVARRLVGQQNLLTLPGAMFGPDQDAYLRLAFANVGADAIADIRVRLEADGN
ncbi:MAG TPA: aminotransferase [Caulobacteraceae bacterium]|jgi:aspartate/methionine/tyrosine aminotransferase|nr:aminotransferase [Caulobacteraceae bacterium]